MDLSTTIRLSVLQLLLTFSLSSKAHGLAPASSPPASTELICHTAHASECYPAVFQPTEHFQRIHDDQSISAGLHVRMNLATGLKEARLNIPEPPKRPRADLAIIDDVPNLRIEEDDPVVETARVKDQSDPDTGYERREPYHPAAFNAEESSLFLASITSLPTATALSDTDLPALFTLQDLAHSIHWGVRLARNSAVCQSLISTIDPKVVASNEVRSAAALLLGTAVHSNPDALDALLSHQYPSEDRLYPVDAVIGALREPNQEGIAFKTRAVFLLSQLCQKAEQLLHFVRSGGLTTLHELFDPDNMTTEDGKDKFRTKVANFIYDRVLSGLGYEDRLATQSGLAINVLENHEALIQDLEPWCDAFAQALRIYTTGAEGLSPAANVAYESIKETNQALMEALAKTRHVRK